MKMMFGRSGDAAARGAVAGAGVAVVRRAAASRSRNRVLLLPTRASWTGACPRRVPRDRVGSHHPRDERHSKPVLAPRQRSDELSKPGSRSEEAGQRRRPPPSTVSGAYRHGRHDFSCDQLLDEPVARFAARQLESGSDICLEVGSGQDHQFLGSSARLYAAKASSATARSSPAAMIINRGVGLIRSM